MMAKEGKDTSLNQETQSLSTKIFNALRDLDIKEVKVDRTVYSAGMPVNATLRYTRRQFSERLAIEMDE